MGQPLSGVGNNTEVTELQNKRKTQQGQTSKPSVDRPIFQKPAERKGMLERWADMITSIEKSILPDLDNSILEERKGNIDTSEKWANGLAGVVQIFTGMLKHPVATMASVAGFAALMSFAGPLAPLLVAGGFTLGTFKVLKAINDADNATTDKAQREAYRSLGAGLFTAITSMFGAKAAVKTAKANGVEVSIDPDKAGMIRNLGECFYLSAGGSKNGTSIYSALSHSWNMKLNQFRSEKQSSKYADDLKAKVDTKKAAKATAQDEHNLAEQMLHEMECKKAAAMGEVQIANTDLETAALQRQQLQAQIDSYNATLNMQRNVQARGYGKITVAPADEMALEGQMIDTAETIAGCQARLDKLTPEILGNRLVKAQNDLANIERDLGAAKSLFDEAQAGLESAASALTSAEAAQKAAQNAPSFIKEFFTSGITNASRLSALGQ